MIVPRVRAYSCILLAFALPIFSFPTPAAQGPEGVIRVRVRESLDGLLNDEDTDRDKKITIDDPHITGTSRGDKKFWLQTVDGRQVQVVGAYFLANLLQELSLAKEQGEATTDLSPARVFEKPSHRTSRLIRENYWDALTRTIDEKGLARSLVDEKTGKSEKTHFLYFPADDSVARRYFSNLALRRPNLHLIARELPEPDDVSGMRSLEEHPGLLSLALRKSSDGNIRGVPFVVPGGRFNEMYGWDSYFILLGLLADHRSDLALAIIDNLTYEIVHYGKILNANRSYYLTRSQPPFLTSMLEAVLPLMPDDSSTTAWLSRSLEAAIHEYKNVWTGPRHMTAIGLSRYFGGGRGVPPEVEPGHFDPVFRAEARQLHMDPRVLERRYRSGAIKVPELDTFFVNDRAMRESGHDTSYRLYGRAAELATVDLNSLLFKAETDIADLLRRKFHGRLRLSDGSVQTTVDWFQRAERRRELMNQYLWDSTRGSYFDYDVRRDVRINYVSATCLYPLWAGCADSLKAHMLVTRILPLLAQPGGISGSDEVSPGPISTGHPQRQWDYPFGWAPHQILTWQGLRRYGYDSIATRLAYRWLFSITLNVVQYNGTVTEKLDVVHRSHDVFAEYGNVGTKFSYITREGFGWTNASYQLGLELLTNTQREALDRLIPPEWFYSR
jgi:alpha,alpha-trehalase